MIQQKRKDDVDSKGKIFVMEISIVELQHVLEVYLSSPLFLFYKESESPNEGSNFDMNKRREMGMVKKLRLVTRI